MKILIIYDISFSNLRNKVINILKDYGFQRIQKSCFFGNLPRKISTEMITRFQEIPKRTSFNLQIYFISNKDIKKKITISK